MEDGFAVWPYPSSSPKGAFIEVGFKTLQTSRRAATARDKLQHLNNTIQLFLFS